MANMASVSYAIEGSEESLKKIAEALIKAVNSKSNKYELYQAAEYLKLRGNLSWWRDRRGTYMG